MMVVLGGGLVIEGRFVILLNTICLRPESEICVRTTLCSVSGSRPAADMSGCWYLNGFA